MKIEGYAAEIADFLVLFAQYSTQVTNISKKSAEKNQASMAEIFPSDKRYPPNYDEGYPPTSASGAQ